MPDHHLSPEEMAAYLDGRIAPADRARLQTHLAHCPDCRREVVETLGYIDEVIRGWIDQR